MTKLTQNTFLRFFIALIISGLLANLVYYLWRFNAPQTTILNWDIFHHQVIVDQIKNGNFSWNPTELSDTFQFQGYLTTFHLLIAHVQKYFPNEPADIISFWWYAEFFHLIAVTVVSFVIGWLLYNYRVGLLSAIVGAMVFVPSGAYTNLFLIPQNVSATFGALGVALLIKALFSESKYKVVFVMAAAFAIAAAFLFHFIIGALAIALALFVLIVKLISLKLPSTHRFWDILCILAVASIILIPVLFSQIDLSYINRGEAGFVNYDLDTKFHYMRDAYGFMFLIFVPIGLFFLNRDRKVSSYAVFFITCGFIAVAVAKIPYSLKLYSLGGFYIHVVIAFAIYKLTQNLKTVWFAGVALVTILVFVPIFVVNSYKYQQTPQYKGIATNISPYELEAAKFLHEEYKNQNVLLVSDPATMQVLEGASGINTPGGAYAGNEARETLSEIYYSQDSGTMEDSIRTIKDGLNKSMPDKHLFAISGRFEEWQNMEDEDKFGIHTNVWYPVDITPKMREEYEFLWFVENKAKLNKVFENKGIVIFEI